MTTMQQLNDAQASAEVPVNENFETVSAVAMFGKRHPATSGLTWGYYGGLFDGHTVADGTLTLTNGAVNYVVVSLSTGALSTSTSTGNWNDPDNYARLYKLTTAGGVVTDLVDARMDAGGFLRAPGSSGGGGPSLPVFDVKLTYGATPDGGTDSTTEIQAAIAAALAAGGGRLFFRRGTGDYVIAGALQDTGRSNSQLVLPVVDVLDDMQITIEFVGEFAPPPIVSVVGDTEVPDGQVVLRSTLSSGSGGAMLGGWGPSGSFLDFTFVHFVARDITFRMPDNPTHTGLDLSHVVSCDVDQVVVDTGSYYVQGLPEPTTASSYGIKFPDNNNGAYTRVGAVNIIGFYQGFRTSEHFVAEQLATWGCKWAGEFTAANHASHISRLMAVHCQHGLKFTGGPHYLRIDQFNIEHAASGWWAPIDDVYDPNDYCYGELQWHVVLAGVGVDSTFTVDGGANLTVAELGAGGGGASAAKVQTGEMMAGFIETVADKTYKLVVKATHAGVITDTTTICGSGTCTATFKVNTTALGGSANAVSSSEQSQAHASSNAFSAGDDIQLTVSANSSCSDFSFRIGYTRTFD